MKIKQLKRSFFLLIGLVGLTLTGCNEKIYATDWTSDAEGHWHACLSHDDEDKKDCATHTYGDWEVVTEASETSLGKKKQVCSVCEYTHYEDITMLEHTHKYSTDWSSNETKHWHASTCGHEVISDEADHTFGKWVETLAPTEEAVGSRKKVCSVCNYESVEEVAKLPHTHKFEYVDGVEPTCVLPGITAHYHCNKCNEDYLDERGIVLIENVILPPTGQHNMQNGVCSTCGETVNGITYIEVKDAEEKVIGYEVKEVTNKDYFYIVVPKLYNDLPIVSIGDNAFIDCTKAVKIEVPDTVTSIGTGALKNCKSIESFKIPNGVTTIKSSTFEHCEFLNAVDIPTSVVTIMNAFNYCYNLSSFVIPKNVTKLGKFVFSFTNLNSISVEEGNTKFDSRDNCNAVIQTADNTLLIGTTTTTIPDTVTSIGTSAFKGNSLLSTITIPSTIKTISNTAFSDCTSLKSISIPEGVTTIGFEAFAMCTKLTSFTLPSSVTSLGSGILYGCKNILSLNVDLNNEIYSSLNNNNAIVELSTLTLVQGIAMTNIDNPYIRRIGDYAFAGINNINTFACSLYIDTIGNYAFYNCTNLKSISYSISLTSIGDYAFQGCTSLASIDLPSNLETIGSYAFQGCTSLNYVLLRNIYNDLTKLGNGIFTDCTLLKVIYYIGETPSNEFNALFPEITIIYYSKTQPTDDGYYWYFNSDNKPTYWSV